ncbi:hypothetical protein EDB89DRAFT_2144030 [Lactarius sanguifluus]|nr:hypothetical protein EDB89DRAFT_2144030 [Lactarius sanguifluus]
MRKLEKAKRELAAETGVVYLGWIPHSDFYESQMHTYYFSQFGDISHLRLSRNKKADPSTTGSSSSIRASANVSQPAELSLAHYLQVYLFISSSLSSSIPHQPQRSHMSRAFPSHRQQQLLHPAIIFFPSALASASHLTEPASL